MKKKNENLEKIYSTFDADSYDVISNYGEWELEFFQRMQKDLGIAEIPKNVKNYMVYFIDQIYETDNSKMLVNMLDAGESCEAYGIQFDADYIKLEFEEGDWFDDNEDHEMMEEAYGEEGYNLYRIYTKNYQHDFREMKPFSNGMEYDGSILTK